MTNAPPDLLEISGAHCTLHWDAPRWRNRKTACVGAFSCDDADSGVKLLKEAKKRARKKNYPCLIGPMDGDTWHRYRVVTFSDNSDPFLLEPVSGPHDYEAFKGAGFQPISNYVSTRANISDAIGKTAPMVKGITITTWDGKNAPDLIDQLFQLSTAAFANNAFFKPITRNAFLKLYEPIIPAIKPEFVLFAKSPNDDLVGFLFGMPNITLNKKDKSVILKTYASAVRGCGRLLVDIFHRRARDVGYDKVIHALMHEDNISLDRSRLHKAKVFRRYALMGINLEETRT